MLNPRHIITEKEKIIRLYEEGASVERIANEIDLSQEYIKGLQGVIQLLVEKGKIDVQKRMDIIEDKDKIKNILMEHKEEIIELFQQGWIAKEIVRKLILPIEYCRELELLLGNLLETKQIDMQRVKEARQQRTLDLEATVEMSQYRHTIRHQKERLEEKGYTVEQLAKQMVCPKEELIYLIQEGIIQGIIDEEEWKKAQIRRKECLRLLGKGLTRSQLMNDMGLSIRQYNYLLREEAFRRAREKGKERLATYKMGLDKERFGEENEGHDM